MGNKFPETDNISTVDDCEILSYLSGRVLSIKS